MNKHTPGPWSVETHEGDIFIVDASGNTGVSKVYSRRKDGTGDANALIIAAAPEMFEALKAWETFMNISDGCDEDDDEGFLAMIKSSSHAFDLTYKVLAKAKENYEPSP